MYEARREDGATVERSRQHPNTREPPRSLRKEGPWDRVRDVGVSSHHTYTQQHDTQLNHRRPNARHKPFKIWL